MATAALSARGEGIPDEEHRSARFGVLLATWRRRSGLSQWKLSLRADVSARHLSFLETGRARPTDAMLRRLAAALGIPPAGEDEMRMALGLMPSHGTPVAADVPLAPRRAETSGELAVRVFETAALLRDARTASTITERARPLLQDLGMGHFHTGTIHVGADGSPRVTLDAAGAPAEQWLERYEAMSYRPRDPLLREAARTHRAFAWSDVTAGGMPLDRIERRIIAEAGEFGISGGFVTPIRRHDRTVRAVSMMGDGRVEQDPSARLALHTIGLMILDQLDRLDTRLAPAVLGDAQLDCLRWTLGGSDASAIAHRLGWSERRVRAELRSACRALGVRRAHHAALRAVALGLLRDA